MHFLFLLHIVTMYFKLRRSRFIMFVKQKSLFSRLEKTGVNISVQCQSQQKSCYLCLTFEYTCAGLFTGLSGRFPAVTNVRPAAGLSRRR